MRIAILVELNDHRRRYAVDEIVELDEEQAGQWIENGWAELVDEEIETATLDAGDEQAVQKRPRGRPRKT